jgi:hypothetical protein
MVGPGLPIHSSSVLMGSKAAGGQEPPRAGIWPPEAIFGRPCGRPRASLDQAAAPGRPGCAADPCFINASINPGLISIA